jgi:hypothetical protein
MISVCLWKREKERQSELRRKEKTYISLSSLNLQRQKRERGQKRMLKFKRFGDALRKRSQYVLEKIVMKIQKLKDFKSN